MRLFFYGTLLDGATLAGRGGDARLPARGVAATLIGWRRVTLRGTRYPTLRRHRAGCVPGVVIVVPSCTLARLAAYERPAYRLTRLVVQTARGKTAAHTWIAPGGTRRPWQAKGS